MLTSLLFALLAAQFPAATPSLDAGAHHAQGVCPAEFQDSRRGVLAFLNNPQHEAGRQQVGLTGYASALPRVLSDASDSSACQRLNATFGAGGVTGDWRSTYFEVGGRYVVVARRIDINGLRRYGWVPLMVFDSSFNRIGEFAV